jgi:hypothetical protein
MAARVQAYRARPGPAAIDEFVQVSPTALWQPERMWNLSNSLSLFAALAVGAAAAPSTPPPRSTPAMPEFALIFRPTRAVPPEDLPRRNAAARAWALGLRHDGKLSFAGPLEEAGVLITSAGVKSLPTERPVAALLVIQARDLDSAVALTKGHPGLAFGTEIEVRPVKPGTAPTPSPSP